MPALTTGPVNQLVITRDPRGVDNEAMHASWLNTHTKRMEAFRKGISRRAFGL
jgi:hypothetical protein